MTTSKTHTEAMKALPAHLQKLMQEREAKFKQFGLIDLASLDKSKYDDFHPIHAMI